MKLSALPIILIGLAVGVVVLSYAYFHEYAVNKQQETYNNEQADLLQAEVDQKAAAEKRVVQANDMVRQKEDAWAQIVATRTLPADLGRGGINLNQDGWHLAIDARKFRNNVQRAVNAQVKKGGVIVVNGPEVPYPGENDANVLATYFNYPAYPFPLVRYDLGQVTVRGSYKQITDNVRTWSTMPHYLAVADGLQITGTAPVLTGTYNVSIVGYIEVNGLYPTVPEGGGGGNQGAGPGGPGGFGGRGGGAPGATGPPGGFGPPPGAIPGGPGRGGGRAGGGVAD